MNNIEEKIKDLISSGYKKNLLTEEEFYFEKGREVFKNFQKYKNNREFFEKLLNTFKDFQSRNTGLKYHEYIKNLENEKYRAFFLMIGKVIAYFDMHADNKSEWNEYEDNRQLLVLQFGKTIG